MTITEAHELAMFGLPVMGRWQTEAQLKDMTGLGEKAKAIYQELLQAGFCELRMCPIICGHIVAEEEVRMYRCEWATRQKFLRALNFQRRANGNKTTHRISASLPGRG